MLFEGEEIENEDEEEVEVEEDVSSGLIRKGDCALLLESLTPDSMNSAGVVVGEGKWSRSKDTRHHQMLEISDVSHFLFLDHALLRMCAETMKHAITLHLFLTFFMSALSSAIACTLFSLGKILSFCAQCECVVLVCSRIETQEIV